MSKKLLAMAVGLAMLSLGANRVWVAEAKAESKENRTYEWAVKPALVPLPPGAIEPAGWLRDWALAARDGLTGNMDGVDSFQKTDNTYYWFRESWKGTQRKEEEYQWLCETAYWMEGLLRLGYLLHDDGLIQKARHRLDAVVNGVNHNTNSIASFIYWKDAAWQLENISREKWNMPAEWETFLNNFANAHMGRALVAYYQASGDRHILDALVKGYANYPEFKWPDFEFTMYPSGIGNIDAMLETYRFSGDRRVLDHVLSATNVPGVQKTTRNWLDGKFKVDHGVCAHDHKRLPALMYLATGDEKYLQAARNAFQWIEQNHMLPYGVSSSEENLTGIGALRSTETCDVDFQIWSSIWLTRITGERAFCDSIERACFNAGPGTVSRDFQTVCYFQSPNRIRFISPHDGGFGRMTYPGCCAGAVHRIVPNYIIHMWMASADQGLAATLYGPCTVNTEVGSRTLVKLICQTTYPFDETIRVTVTPERSVSFPLVLPYSGMVRPSANCRQRHSNGIGARCQRFCPYRTAMGQGRYR